MQKNILLVDDESSIRRSLFLSLTQEGYTIEPCENGINAIKKLHQYKQNDLTLDTVVLDIQLPDIDGIKLGKIIKSQYPETNIIFMTGYSDKINAEDLDTLSDSRLLEKPFTAKDLTSQIEEIYKNQEKTLSVPDASKFLKESKSSVKTYSAYALLKIDPKVDFFEVYRKLYFNNNVLYCDATSGEYDIFLLMQSNTPNGCKEICENNIKSVEGVREVEFLEISNPILDDSMNNLIYGSNKSFGIEPSDLAIREMRSSVSSYVLLEIAKEKLDSIFPSLYFNDNIVYCDYTDSRYNLVLLVHGTQFAEIDNLIKNKIAPLDGVLKVKEFPIITIFEM
jgi:CheY-like chemotaxis protein